LTNATSEFIHTPCAATPEAALEGKLILNKLFCGTGTASTIMFQLRCLFALLVCQYVASSSLQPDMQDGEINKMTVVQHLDDLILSPEDLALPIDQEDSSSAVDDHGHRFLQVQAVPCPGGGPISYFTLEIKFVPQGGFNTNQCTSAKRQQLGAEINTLLKNYGVGQLGVGDNAAYLAKVCTNPIVQRRRLQSFGFLWKGGGTCRYCSNDNFDKRQLQSFDPNWFKNIYAPELQNILRNAITSKIAPKYVVCLGNGPQVLVTVTEVASSQLKLNC
jgi:hypothetical protein